MKRKDLYKYVRTEIINELTEEAVAWNSSNKTGAKQQIDKSKLSGDAKTQAKAEIDQNPSGLISNVSENDLEEARKGNNLKAGPNFTAIKSAYAGSVIERILNAIEETGDVGIEPKNIQATIGFKNSSELNPIIGELKELGAIVGPAPKEVEAEPEEITPEDDLVNLGIPKVTDNPEDKEVDDDELIAADDEYYKPEEEEDSTEDEIKIDPKTADKDAKKTFGSQSLNKKTLSSEEQAMYDKFKTSVDKHIATIGNKKSTPEQIKIARQFLEKYKNNKDLVSLFRSQGNKDLK
jgi:hypothetical protein